MLKAPVKVLREGLRKVGLVRKKQPDARKAKLTAAHVLALRLYTSNSYARINGPLRDGARPHPFPATTYYIHDAIAKLLLAAGRDEALWDAYQLRYEIEGVGGIAVAGEIEL